MSHHRLFTSLCAQIDGGHFANAIKTCDKILRLDADDVDAYKTKLFLLLQTEQYDAALALLRTDNKFEHAYALYRLQREQEATALLDQLPNHRGALHLRAQIAYRTGIYSHAVDLYTQLLESADLNSEEQTDIQTNLHAAQSHLDFTSTGFLRALPPSLISSIEYAPPPQPQPQHSQLFSASISPVNKKNNNTRKSRVPPGVVPGITPPPDPERWIKKSERSVVAAGASARRKKGAGAGAGGGATQGSVGVEPAPALASAGAQKGRAKAKGRK